MALLCACGEGWDEWFEGEEEEGQLVERGATDSCASGLFWEGEEGSSLMHPGQNCIACHADDPEGEAPAFQVAGTVMNGFDEEDDCAGAEGVTVEITGADGEVNTLVTNRAGNFFVHESDGIAITLPYTARVLVGDAVREMATPQSDLNCMSCHTREGAGGAPGRIVKPE